MTHASDNRYKRLYSTQVNDGKSSHPKKFPDPTEEKRRIAKEPFKKRRPQG